MLSDRPLINVRVDHRANFLLLLFVFVLLVPGLLVWPYRTYAGGLAYGTAAGATATALTAYACANLAADR